MSWPFVHLQEIGHVSRGRSRHRPRYDEKLYGGAYPFIQTGDIKASGGRITKYNQTYNEFGLSQSKLWPENTMAITIAANIAETAILTFPACFPDSVVGFIADPKKANIYFIEYVFRKLRSEIQRKATGSVQDNINMDTISKISFPLPPLEKQNEIVDILKSFDDKIELNNQINETLEAMAKAIFKEWFIDFGPVKVRAGGKKPFGMDDEVAFLFPNGFEDSELGQIPKGWEIKTIADSCDLLMGQSPPGETYNETGDGMVFYQGRAEFGKRYPSPRLFCTEPSRIVKKGTVLLSIRAPVGDINVSTEEQTCIGRGLAGILHKTGGTTFTYHLLQSLKDKFEMYNGEGTVFGAINKDTLSGLKYVSPSRELLTKFLKLVQPLDELYFSNFKEIVSLTQTRDLLLPKLISGEISIKEGYE